MDGSRSHAHGGGPRFRLGYANVVSTLCLFVLLGGGAYAAETGLARNSVGTGQLKKGAVTTAKIKDGAVTGAKVNVASLPTVPSATDATHATSADTATSAERATTAGTATTAQSAANASQLGGAPASSYAKSEQEALHFVGTPGNPLFGSGCANFGGGFANASFYKDSLGIVHLNGFITGCGSGGTAFTLPPGFRPEGEELFVTRGTGDTATATVRIAPSGDVVPFSTADPTLSGITFRAAG